MAIIFLAVGFTASSARATDPAVGVTCSPVNARIVTFYFVDGCTSVYGVCTAGTVDSGVLAGTTQFGVTSITPGDTPGVLLYTGELGRAKKATPTSAAKMQPSRIRWLRRSFKRNQVEA